MLWYCVLQQLTYGLHCRQQDRPAVEDTEQSQLTTKALLACLTVICYALSGADDLHFHHLHEIVRYRHICQYILRGAISYQLCKLQG